MLKMANMALRRTKACRCSYRGWTSEGERWWYQAGTDRGEERLENLCLSDPG